MNAFQSHLFQKFFKTSNRFLNYYLCHEFIGKFDYCTKQKHFRSRK